MFGAAFAFCALAYIMVALTGLSLYGAEVKHDILLNIAKDGFGGHLIRVAYTVIPLMSIPVLFLVAKQSLIDMVFEKVPGGPDIPQPLYLKLTLGLFSAAVILALVLHDVGLAYAFIGSCSTMLNT